MTKHKSLIRECKRCGSASLSLAIRPAIKRAIDALFNVPEVGQVYDRQHSDTQLQSVTELRALLGQKPDGTSEPLNFARIIYEAYPSHDLLPVDPDKHCKDLATLYKHVRSSAFKGGDSLFKFIVCEAQEGGEKADDGQVNPDLVIHVLERARDDVQAVIDAIADLGSSLPQPEEKGAVEGGPWACECDNTHKANSTVCRYCQEVLGRRKWDDPMPERIVARFQPQVVLNDNFLDEGPAIPVDVTDAVLKLPRQEAMGIEDDDYPSDELMPASLLDWHKARHGTESGFRVEVEEVIKEHFKKHPHKSVASATAGRSKQQSKPKETLP